MSTCITFHTSIPTILVTLFLTWMNLFVSSLIIISIVCYILLLRKWILPKSLRYMSLYGVIYGISYCTLSTNFSTTVLLLCRMTGGAFGFKLGKLYPVIGWYKQYPQVRIGLGRESWWIFCLVPCKRSTSNSFFHMVRWRNNRLQDTYLIMKDNLLK